MQKGEYMKEQAVDKAKESLYAGKQEVRSAAQEIKEKELKK